MHYHRHIWRNSHATCTYRLALSKCRPTAFSPTRRINDPPPTMACPVAADHKTLRTLPWAPCKPTPFSHRSPVQFPSVAIVRLPITVHHRHQRTTTTTTCSMCHGFPKHRKYNTYNIHIYIYSSPSLKRPLMIYLIAIFDGDGGCCTANINRVPKQIWSLSIRLYLIRPCVKLANSFVLLLLFAVSFLIPYDEKK